MKILLYGGAFNPPHMGHVRILESAIKEVEPDLTLVVPSDVSPHKKTEYVPFAHRAAMARCFLGCGGKVVVSWMEKCKNRRRSYTIKTLRRLRRRYPGSEIYMLIGSDSLLAFKTWKNWRRILTMCTLVVAARDDMPREVLEEALDELKSRGAGGILMNTQPFDVSSSEIRARLESGGNCTGLVPADVEEYIRKHGLYGTKQ
ncbi:MAG: nicotinate (nicotinamide) nucleotide adenylyltransferase [Oscillospiraceae bacterium]|jgi:nicotinate-nucleotide adenylyltransferase